MRYSDCRGSFTASITACTSTQPQTQQQPSEGAIVVCQYQDIPEGGSSIVRVNGEEVAVWKVLGKLYATANRCSHKQAKLSLGDIEDLDGPAVRCPKHRGKFAGGLYFSLEDGHSFTKRPCASHNSCWAVSAYRVWQGDNGQVMLWPQPKQAGADDGSAPDEEEIQPCR